MIPEPQQSNFSSAATISCLADVLAACQPCSKRKGYNYVERGMFSYVVYDVLLVVVIHREGSTGAGELDDEDQEEDDHVEEQEDLVVPDSADQPDD